LEHHAVGSFDLAVAPWVGDRGIVDVMTGLVKVIPVASTILRVESRFDLDLALHVAGCYVSGIAQAKRHAGGRRSRARAFDALTDFDCVREHTLDRIPAIRSLGVGGWVFFDRSVSICWLVVTRQAAGAVDVAGIEPKQMSTGFARKSAMLSGKMTQLVEAIELHEEP
jgi:hypothetical protein